LQVVGPVVGDGFGSDVPASFVVEGALIGEPVFVPPSPEGVTPLSAVRKSEDFTSEEQAKRAVESAVPRTVVRKSVVRMPETVGLGRKRRS
jgi:hypothetical protein